MYLFIYILVYLFSLLPWRLLYIISDIIALLLQHVLKYRVKVVAQNLAIAFPQKTAKERQKIANEFYQQFTDSFIETFKLISISDKNFDKRFTSNVEVLN
ncbi:MAG: lipid A biosynthesis acyltransferase, partial [Chitinophagia bacterium]|nr:lipid A biosynthesis acyltransferase [Chitinophagia bacterium]